MAKYDYGSLKMGSATSTKRMKESKQRMQAQVTAVQNIVQDSKRQDIPYDQLIRYADNRENDDENIDSEKAKKKKKQFEDVDFELGFKIK